MKQRSACAFHAILSTVCLLGQAASPISNNPTYSEAVQKHLDPYQFFLEIEAKMNQEAALLGHPAPYQEALAAKAALEAGENNKALTYAKEALATAKQIDGNRKQLGAKHRRYPEVQFYANFVLGRLALLNNDLRSAEQYLLAAGQTYGGPVLSSYGPNMSLALELLKRGDAHSWQTVSQFIGEVKSFWKIAPDHAPFDTWLSQIRTGNIPNFEAVGPNLYN